MVRVLPTDTKPRAWRGKGTEALVRAGVGTRYAEKSLGARGTGGKATPTPRYLASRCPRRADWLLQGVPPPQL